MDQSGERRCSFCGKKEAEVLKLVAGPGVFICNRCVAIASEIVNDSYENDSPELQPKTGAVISDREGFKIEEVSEIVGVRPHVIRYWETEFLQVNPEKDELGQRIYSQRDLDVLKRIHHLLFEDRYTIHNTKIQLAKEFD